MPDPAALSTPGDVAREIQRLADALYPGLGVTAELRIKLPNGRETVVCGLGANESPLNEMERDILLALNESGPDGLLTGERLAELAGYDFDSRFRTTLSKLAKGGHVHSNRPGYSLSTSPPPRCQ